MARDYRKWTHDEDTQLLFLREHVKMSFADIDVILKRKPDAARGRYRVLRPQAYRIKVAPTERHTRNIVEREALRARQAASLAPPLSMTAAFFGDPPPGRSALDKKRMGVTA
ncbi:hypothetical protein ACRQ5Q_22455 [Bradyrhizobium sp. PMVTL-01]|uniref:hypothetical protein n=1 Tax=Bradyrhizobium sp. PMVTL-01 TaxID=3434999 RepID=UPI003F6EB2BA